MLFRTRPIPVITRCGRRKRSMSFGQRAVDFERPKPCSFGKGENLARRKHAERTKRDIAIRESGLSKRVLRVSLERFMEVLNPQRQVF